MTLGYPRSYMISGLKVKDQGHRVNKCVFHNNDYYAYVYANLTDNSNTAWV